MSFHSASIGFEATARRSQAAPTVRWTARALAQIWTFMGECHRRSFDRGFLVSLDERTMHDLGYHRVQEEIAKPFWRG